MCCDSSESHERNIVGQDQHSQTDKGTQHRRECGTRQSSYVMHPEMLVCFLKSHVCVNVYFLRAVRSHKLANQRPNAHLPPPESSSTEGRVREPPRQRRGRTQRPRPLGSRVQLVRHPGSRSPACSRALTQRRAEAGLSARPEVAVETAVGVERGWGWASPAAVAPLPRFADRPGASGPATGMCGSL